MKKITNWMMIVIPFQDFSEKEKKELSEREVAKMEKMVPTEREVGKKDVIAKDREKKDVIGKEQMM